MGGALKLGRVAGIDIKVHFTFGLVVLWGAWQGSVYGARGAAFFVALLLLVFACVVLHELGHSLVAKAFGVEVREITLLPIGGVAQMTSRPRTPGQELLVALAGPAVNVVLALALLVGLSATTPGWTAQLWAPLALTGDRLWVLLFTSNVMLALFNLLPAFPMDGGRVLRAVLSWPLGVERATRVAVTVGRVLAVGLLVLGLTRPGFTMLPFVALFIFLLGGMELRELEVGSLLEGIRAGDAVNPYVPRFSPDTSLVEAARAFVFTPADAFAVEHFGRLLGVVTRGEVLEATRRAVGPAFVAGVMDRQPPRVSANATLEQARDAMAQAQVPYVAVVDGELLLGLITARELLQQAELARLVRRSPPPATRPAERWP